MIKDEFDIGGKDERANPSLVASEKQKSWCIYSLTDTPSPFPFKAASMTHPTQPQPRSGSLNNHCKHRMTTHK